MPRADAAMPLRCYAIAADDMFYACSAALMPLLCCYAVDLPRYTIDVICQPLFQGAEITRGARTLQRPPAYAACADAAALRCFHCRDAAQRQCHIAAALDDAMSFERITRVAMLASYAPDILLLPPALFLPRQLQQDFRYAMPRLAVIFATRCCLPVWQYQ